MSQVFAIISSIIPVLSSADGELGRPRLAPGGVLSVWPTEAGHEDSPRLLGTMFPWLYSLSGGRALFKPGLPSQPFRSGRTLGRGALFLMIRSQPFQFARVSGEGR